MSVKAWRIKAELDGDNEKAALLRIMEEQSKTLATMKENERSITSLLASLKSVNETVHRQSELLNKMPSALRSIKNPAQRFVRVFTVVELTRRILVAKSAEEISNIKSDLIVTLSEIDKDEEICEMITNCLEFDSQEEG